MVQLFMEIHLILYTKHLFVLKLFTDTEINLD
jgi:hypothetical protein